MHTLTIDTGTITVTDHDDPDAARQALNDFLVRGDYYLRPLQTTTAHIRFELLVLQDDYTPGRTPREPQVAGTATIEQQDSGSRPVDAPYFTACEAQRWISDAQHTWQRRDRDNPYPAAVLTLARGAAHGHIGSDSLLNESAQLAGGEDDTRPDAQALEALRHNAISAPGASPTPAAIAAAVQHHLRPGSSDGAVATLVWYYTLIAWGAHT